MTTGKNRKKVLIVGRLPQAGIDVLYYSGYPVEAGSIVRQMREQGLATVLVAGDGVLYLNDLPDHYP